MSAPRWIRKLYRDADDGFEIPRGEERDINRSGGDPLYGELTPGGVSTLLRKLKIGPRDVFYDLGSGTGKVVLQVAMSTKLKRCVGYELSPTRCKIARSRLRAARKLHPFQAGRTAFYATDFLQAPLQDATVIYACATAFSDRFMRKLMRRLTELPGPITFISLRVLDDHRHFVLREVFRLETSWDSGSPAYVYDVIAKRNRSRL